MVNWTPVQQDFLDLPENNSLSLRGIFGAGKTSVSVARLLRMLAKGIGGNSILLVAPHRYLLSPYEQALRSSSTPSGGQLTLLTYGGLAQRMVRLFWPLAVEAAGFGSLRKPPTFLTLETAQYWMAHLILPMIEEKRLFASVTIERNRIYSQILDNLNKAAIVGFPYTEIGERLNSIWDGQPGLQRVCEDVQICANAYRSFCLSNNLLDYSMQIEVFRRYLWINPICRGYLKSSFHHLIYENVEEDPPAAHDLIREWLPDLQSALLILDENAGYRRFLGADPLSALELIERCDNYILFPDSLVQSKQLVNIRKEFNSILSTPGKPHFLFRDNEAYDRLSSETTSRETRSFEKTLNFQSFRFIPEMIDWAANTIRDLVMDEGIAPEHIAVIAPYMSDSLRFSIFNRLIEFQIPVRSHRPSRALREEPASKCLLDLAAIAHPQWGFKPSRFDVAYSLLQAIEGLDLARAQLLANIVYHPNYEGFWLTSFDEIQSPMQERITYLVGEMYEKLRIWLFQATSHESELDHFLSRLFGEVLSQPGFGFHSNYDAGLTAARLIESVQKFRWAASEMIGDIGGIGKEFLTMVIEGVIAAGYLQEWNTNTNGAVLIAPAYAFLLENKPVDVQIWLDAGSRSWSERLFQPLTHPYVLSRNWPANRSWSDMDEFAANRESTRRLVIGLLLRCRKSIYLGFSQLGEQGYEQRGPLLAAFQKLLRNEIDYRSDVKDR